MSFILSQSGAPPSLNLPSAVHKPAHFVPDFLRSYADYFSFACVTVTHARSLTVDDP